MPLRPRVHRFRVGGARRGRRSLGRRRRRRSRRGRGPAVGHRRRGTRRRPLGAALGARRRTLALHRGARAILVRSLRPILLRSLRPILLRSLRPTLLRSLRPILLRSLRPILVRGLRPILLRSLRPILLRSPRPILLRSLRPILLWSLRPILLRRRRVLRPTLSRRRRLSLRPTRSRRRRRRHGHGRGRGASLLRRLGPLRLGRRPWPRYRGRDRGPRRRRLHPARRHELRRQLAVGVRAPDLVRVARARLQRRVDLREVAQDVPRVAQEVHLGAAVVRRRDDLREIDDRRAGRAPEHVVRREVAVDELGRQDLHQLRQHVVIRGVRLRGVEAGVDDARGRLAVLAEHQLHQKDPLDVHHRRRHPHAGAMKRVERLDLGRLPGVLGGRAAERRAAGHRALIARVSDHATLFVARVVLEAALVPVLVRLGRDDAVAVLDDEHLGLFAGLQTPKDRGDDAFLE